MHFMLHWIFVNGCLIVEKANEEKSRNRKSCYILSVSTFNRMAEGEFEKSGSKSHFEMKKKVNRKLLTHCVY